MTQLQPPHSARIAKSRLKQNRHIPENLTLDALKTKMYAPDLKDRLQAIQGLDSLGTDDALATLVELLPDENPYIRKAISAILLRQHPRYAQLLNDCVIEGELPNRMAALNVIASDLSERHVNVLTLCLRDNHPREIQRMAERILLAINTPEAVRIATTWRQQLFDAEAAANHARYQRQLQEQKASGDTFDSPTQPMQIVNHRQAFNGLLKHIRSGQWGDQQDAAKAIHRLIRSICNDPSADYRGIRQDFVDLLRDPEQIMRWVAIEALTRLNDPQTVPDLVECLRDPSWTVRVAAIRALVEIGDVAVITHLEKLFTDPNTSVQEAAVEAIGLLGSAKDVPLLASVIDGEYEDMVRLAAIEAIYRLNGTNGVPVLVKVLNDTNTTIRWHAAKALSELAGEDVIAVLIRHLGDKSRPRWEEKRVCDWLAVALQRINTPVARVALKRWQQTLF